VRPEALCGLLAEEEGLRGYAAVLLGAGTPSEVAARSRLPARDVVIALRRLETGGLLSIVDGRYVAETGVFKDAVREYGPEATPEEPLEPDRQRAAILRAWYDDYLTVRRYLIDEDLMDRDQGVYWRTGGYVEL